MLLIYTTGTNLFTLKIILALASTRIIFLRVKIGSTNEFAPFSWDAINAHRGQIYCQFARTSPWKCPICICGRRSIRISIYYRYGARLLRWAAYLMCLCEMLLFEYQCDIDKLCYEAFGFNDDE